MENLNWNWFPKEFEVGPKRKLVPFEFIYHNTKFANLWSSASTLFTFCKFGSV
jgi:hypothetical protein